MEKKKKTKIAFSFSASIALIAIIAISSLLLPLHSVSSFSPQSVKTQAAPTIIPGWIFQGMYLRTGINYGGTIGVGQADPGTGFQFPIGPGFESLAIWWWGEGYVVCYKILSPTGIWVDNVAYWWPSLGIYPNGALPPPWGSGQPPAFCNIVIVNNMLILDDNNTAHVRTVVQTLDGVLEITFDWEFPKQQAYLKLMTTIKNLSNQQVRDVLYKRIVDWDIWWNVLNDWTCDCHAAFASLYINATTTICMSVTGWGYHETLSPGPAAYVDLYAWDDIKTTPASTTPTTRHPGTKLIQTHNSPDLAMDYNAALYYEIGDLWGKVKRSVLTVYQAATHPGPKYGENPLP